MSNLAQQRCFNHAAREAVARCRECTNFFCRECITEHDDRVVCAACLKKLAAQGLAGTSKLARVLRTAEYALGILIAWFFFSLIGESLARLPDTFHNVSLWRVPWIDR